MNYRILLILINSIFFYYLKITTIKGDFIKISIAEKATRTRFGGKIYRNLEIEGDGTGTKEDPIHIDTHQLPSDFLIIKSKVHLKLENLDLSYLRLFRSQNISIEKSKIVALELNQCSDIQIIEMSKINFLDLIGSENNVIENCIIGKFKSLGSMNNQIKDCKIDKISRYKRSRNNLIIRCIIPPKENIKLEKMQKERFSYYSS